MADARGRAFRKSNARNIDAVEDWLARLFEPTDFDVRAIEIECPAPDEIGTLSRDPHFSEAFSNKRDSDLHSFLKYVARRWLQRQQSLSGDSDIDEVFYEQRVYFPYADVEIEYIDCEPEYDLRYAQALPHGADVFYGDCGHIIVVDVFGRGRNVEIGMTQPWNLVAPVFTGVSERAIWLPFPSGIRPKDFSLSEYDFRTLPAYEIHDPERELENED